MKDFNNYSVLGFNFFVHTDFIFCYDEKKERIVIFDENDDYYFFIIKFRKKENGDYSIIFNSKALFLQGVDDKNVYIRRYNADGKFF